MEGLIPKIEAILFASGKPVSSDKITSELGIEKSVLRRVIEYLKEKYSDDESGIQVVEAADGYQIVTKPRYNEMLKSFYGNRRISRLSVPALEALAIIAYKQPVTRPEIEEIRGVNSDGVLKTLMERDLIIRRGHADLPGRPSLYYTTKKFLSYFKITSLKELPPIQELTGENEEDQKVLFDEDEN